jgi:hypothetical protein
MRRSGAATYDFIRSSDVPTYAESGVASSYSMLIDCTAADASLVAGDYSAIRYVVEGHDYAVLKGKTVTLSFWIKATITGVYCVAFQNNGSDRSYVAEVTVNVTDTWEKKSVTLTLNPSGGTDDFTTGAGLKIFFCLSGKPTDGTYRTATANSWQTGEFLHTDNQVNGASSTANNLRLAQVMLNIGGTAAPFQRAGGTIAGEQDLCQRYFEKSYELATTPGTGTTTGAAYLPSNTLTSSSQYMAATFGFKTAKRVAPVLAYYDCSTNSSRVSDFTTGGLTQTNNRNTVYSITATTSAINIINNQALSTFSGFHWTADSDFT